MIANAAAASGLASVAQTCSTLSGSHLPRECSAHRSWISIGCGRVATASSPPSGLKPHAVTGRSAGTWRRTAPVAISRSWIPSPVMTATARASGLNTRSDQLELSIQLDTRRPVRVWNMPESYESRLRASTRGTANRRPSDDSLACRANVWVLPRVIKSKFP